MKHGSLFSGIGGFDLAAEWAGWENVFHCEINTFGQKVLKYYWPNAISYEDITKTDFTIHRGNIDILTGGFPCQPFSLAGKRLGTADHRNLWPEYYRAIKEIQPTWVVGENVFGLINWSKGLVFEQVQADLENEGYKVWPVILPACSVNAPHRRDRVWFIAYAESNGSMRTSDATSQSIKRQDRNQTEQFNECSKIFTTSTPNTNSNGHELRGLGEDRPKENESQREGNQRERVWNDSGRIGEQGIITNTERKRQQEQGQPERQLYKKENREWKASWAYDDGRWPTQPPVCSGNDGIPARLDGITFPKWRNESIKTYGNAIVPQVVYQIFKTIGEFENEKQYI